MESGNIDLPENDKVSATSPVSVTQKMISEPDSFRPIMLVLEQAAPGAFIFIESNTPVERRKFPELIKQAGFPHPIYYIHILRDLPPELPLYQSLRGWLKEKDFSGSTPILALDGFDANLTDEKTARDWLQVWNFSREALAALNAILVFLIPTFGIEYIRRYAPDIWSWRAFHFKMPASIEKGAGVQFIPARVPLARVIPGDNPEKRASRIRVLRQLLKEELERHGSIEAAWRGILRPLVEELGIAGRYAEATNVLNQAKDWVEAHPEAPESAEYWNLKGRISQDMGELEQAEEYFHRALKIYEKELGEKHSKLATVMNNIGMLLKEKGNLDGALRYLQRALKIDEDVSGKEHTDVARDINNIAGVLKSKNDLDGALRYLQRALGIYEKTFGKNHPNVATVMNNIGMVLKEKGDLDGALRYLQRALMIRKKVLGREAPDVAACSNNIATVLFTKGESDSALPYFKQALKIYENTFEKDHPMVATTLTNVAAVLWEKGDLENACPLIKRAFIIYLKTFGPQHQDTINSFRAFIQCGGDPNDLIAELKDFPNASQIIQSFYSVFSEMGIVHTDTPQGTSNKDSVE